MGDAVFVPIGASEAAYYDGGAPARACCNGACWCTRRSIGIIVASVVAVAIVGGLVGGLVHEKKAPFVPPYSLNETALANAFTFVALGDWGRDGAYGQSQVAATMATVGALTNARLVTSVGDDFYPNGVNSKSDSQFTSSWLNIYVQPWFSGKQWVLALGNRDYEGQYLPVGWTGDKRWYEPSAYFAVTWPLPSGGGSTLGACVLAVFIDTTALIDDYRTNPENQNMANNLQSANATAQLQWLRSTLAANAASTGCRSTLVVGHHPIYSTGSNGDEPDLVSRVLPLLQEYVVDAYVCGHTHNLQHLTPPAGAPAAPQDYIVTGAGSQTSTGRSTSAASAAFFSGDSGFTVHSWNATHVRHSWVDVGGFVLHGVTRALARV